MFILIIFGIFVVVFIKLFDVKCVFRSIKFSDGFIFLILIRGVRFFDFFSNILK